jgi:hypothetical protein
MQRAQRGTAGPCAPAGSWSRSRAASAATASIASGVLKGREKGCTVGTSSVKRDVSVLTSEKRSSRSGSPAPASSNGAVIGAPMCSTVPRQRSTVACFFPSSSSISISVPVYTRRSRNSGAVSCARSRSTFPRGGTKNSSRRHRRPSSALNSSHLPPATRISAAHATPVSSQPGTLGPPPICPSARSTIGPWSSSAVSSCQKPIRPGDSPRV